MGPGGVTGKAVDHPSPAVEFLEIICFSSAEWPDLLVDGTQAEKPSDAFTPAP